MKRLFGLLLFCILLFVLVVAASPYYTLYQAKQNYEQGNYADVVALVDYERVRPKFKDELHERLDHTLSSNTILQGMATLLPDVWQTLTHQGHTLIDNSVDVAITPDNLTQLLSGDINTDSKKLIAAWAIASNYIDYQQLIKDALRSGGDIEHAIKAQEQTIHQHITTKQSKEGTQLGYCGYDCFEVQGNISGLPIGVRLYRNGLIDWKIDEIKLP